LLSGGVGTSRDIISCWTNGAKAGHVGAGDGRLDCRRKKPKQNIMNAATIHDSSIAGRAPAIANPIRGINQNQK
jgi:hypothetical protein